MARATRHQRLRMDLHDFLRAEHYRFLDGESERLSPVSGPLWSLGQGRYPLDADTCAAVRGIIENYVLPWSLLEKQIEEWVFRDYPELLDQAEDLHRRRLVSDDDCLEAECLYWSEELAEK